MSDVYIDESGDLGFNEKGSKYFVISAVLINDDNEHKRYLRIPKKVRQRLLKKSNKKIELKYCNSSSRIKELFLLGLSNIDVSLFSISVRKSNVKPDLRKNIPILYNYLLRILLEKVLPNADRQSLTITIDRSFSKNIRMDMEVYVQTSLVEFFKQLPKVSILHESSQNNSGLQVIDFVAGAIHDNLKGNGKFVSIIVKKLKVDKMLF